MLPVSSRVLAADLQVVRAAEEVVLEEADRAGVLVAPPLQQPVAAAAEHLVAVERLVAGVGGVADQPEVVAELAGAELGEHVLAEGAVPLALVDPARRVLQGGRVGGDVGRRAAGVDVGAVRLLLGAVLQVADELVVLGHLVAELAGVVEQLGVERRAVEEAARGRRGHRVALVQVVESPPDLVADDRAADADVEVLVAGQPVAVRPDRRCWGRSGRPRGCVLWMLSSSMS